MQEGEMPGIGRLSLEKKPRAFSKAGPIFGKGHAFGARSIVLDAGRTRDGRESP